MVKSIILSFSKHPTWDPLMAKCDLMVVTPKGNAEVEGTWHSELRNWTWSLFALRQTSFHFVAICVLHGWNKPNQRKQKKSVLALSVGLTSQCLLKYSSSSVSLQLLKNNYVFQGETWTHSYANNMHHSSCTYSSFDWSSIPNHCWF